MNLVIAHSSLHWLEYSLFAIPGLVVSVAIVRETLRRSAAPTKENR